MFTQAYESETFAEPRSSRLRIICRAVLRRTPPDGLNRADDAFCHDTCSFYLVIISRYYSSGIISPHHRHAGQTDYARAAVKRYVVVRRALYIIYSQISIVSVHVSLISVVHLGVNYMRRR